MRQQSDAFCTVYAFNAIFVPELL